MKSINVTKLPQKNAPWFVGILVFDQVEVLDFCGPFEVLSVARFLDEDNQRTDDCPFTVRLISETDGLIRCRGDLKVITDFNFDNHPELDLVLVPGGWGTRKEVHNPVLIEWLKAQNKKIQLMASVCTGSFLLAEAGLLDGLESTTHWASIERMRKTYPTIQVMQGKRLIVSGQGRIVASAGIAAGIDMSLFLVSELVGEEIAQITAHYMEYPWK
ncbi:MAG: DJ-1/PfpI family protein [Candidatus Hodarchaeales archaeon]